MSNTKTNTEIEEINEINFTDCFGPAYYDMFHDLEARNNLIYWMEGGRGSVKGSTAYLYTIFDLTRDAENGIVTHAVGLRKVGLTIRDSVFNNFLWAINKLGLSDSWDYTISPMKIFHKENGNSILFRGCANQRDFEKIKSLKFEKGYCKIAIFEELTEFDGMEEVDSIQQSLFRGADDNESGNEESITFVMYNPPASRSNWVNEESNRIKKLLANGENIGIYQIHTTYLQVPKKWLGRPFLKKAELTKKYNMRAYRHQYLGEQTGEGLEIYPPLTLDNPQGLVEYRTITDEEIEQFTKIERGLDFGYSNATCYAEVYIDVKRDIIYIIDEVYLYHANNATLAHLIGLKAGKKYIVGDSEDPRTINEMCLLGLNCGKAKKGKDSKDHGINWLRGRGRIVIDKKRTPNIATDFETYEFEKKDGKIIYDFPKEPDGSAAVRYALEKYTINSKLKFGVKR